MATKKLQEPLDCISRVRFAPQARSTQLLVSSWDAHVRLYDVSAGVLTAMYKHGQAVLDCTYVGSDRVVSVGLDRRVVCWDMHSRQELCLGYHDDPVRCVEFEPGTQQLFTGGWDRTLRMWDVRRPGAPTQTLNVTAKVFAMDVGVNRVLLAGSDRHTQIFDLRRMDVPMDKRESPLKHQLRAVKVGIDQRGFASSSVEGRVAIEYLDAEESQQSRYAFKCHREKGPNNEEVIHPVNCIAFHPVHGTFATGGGDGGVCIWDGYAKKRLWRQNPFDKAVSGLCFSSDGSMLAMAVSDIANMGDRGPEPAPELVVRHVSDVEVLPKSKVLAVS